MSDQANAAAAVEQPPIPTIQGVDPGELGKSLEFHDVKNAAGDGVDADKVRLTIVNEKGDKESVVVLYGDVNMALSVKGHNPAQGGGGGESLDLDIPETAPAPEGAENVVNEGENLDRTDTNPELDPHQPGVEPDDAPVNSGTNAPASTDPEGDTAKQNAPEAPAPEPDGPNVATNPGTDSTSDAQTEVPDPTSTTPPGEAPGDAGPGDTPAAAPEPQPAADASEKPLYVYVGEDPAWTPPAGYFYSGLVTPEGKVLYHYTDDTAGEPHTGGVDGELGVYADDVVPATGTEGQVS